MGLIGGTKPADVPYLPFALDEVEIMRALPTTCYAYAEFSGSEEHVRAGIRKFDILLLSEAGDVVVKLKGFYVRPVNVVVQGKKDEEAGIPDSDDVPLTHVQWAGE